MRHKEKEAGVAHPLPVSVCGRRRPWTVHGVQGNVCSEGRDRSALKLRHSPGCVSLGTSSTLVSTTILSVVFDDQVSLGIWHLLCFLFVQVPQRQAATELHQRPRPRPPTLPQPLRLGCEELEGKSTELGGP